MTYEAVPSSIAASPSLLTQYVQGRLPAVREVPDPAENVRQLVGMVEGGWISLEMIRGTENDPTDSELAGRVGTEVQRRHQENVATETTRRLEAAGVVEVHVLAGIDDVPGAMKRLKAKTGDWTLDGDLLRVAGQSEDTVRGALQEARP